MISSHTYTDERFWQQIRFGLKCYESNPNATHMINLTMNDKCSLAPFRIWKELLIEKKHTKYYYSIKSFENFYDMDTKMRDWWYPLLHNKPFYKYFLHLKNIVHTEIKTIKED